MFGRTWGELVDSHLIELLNPAPAAGSDFSRVQTGKLSGIGVSMVPWQMASNTK